MLPPSTGAFIRVSAPPPAHLLASVHPTRATLRRRTPFQGTSADVLRPNCDDVRASGRTSAPPCAAVAYLALFDLTLGASVWGSLPPNPNDTAGS